jgi:hypothetical protein
MSALMSIAILGFPPDSATIAMLSDLWSLTTTHPKCIFFILASIPVLLTNLTVLFSLVSMHYRWSDEMYSPMWTPISDAISDYQSDSKPESNYTEHGHAYEYTTYPTLLREWTLCLLLGFCLGVPPTLLASCIQDWGMYFIKEYVEADMQTPTSIVFSVVFYMGMLTWLGMCWANVARSRLRLRGTSWGVEGEDVDVEDAEAGVVDEELPSYEEKERVRW